VTQVRAVFAGLATWDVIHRVDRLPLPNEKIAALDFAAAAGGPAANAAVAFAACGGGPTLVSVLPAHPLSDLIVGDLATCGVAYVSGGTYAGPPITASILVTAATGERAVVSPYNSVTPVPANVGFDVLDHATALLIDGHFREASLPLAREARVRGIPVILDAGSIKPYTPALLEHVDVAVVSSAFTPDEGVYAYLTRAGVHRVVVTAGGDRLRWRTPAGQGEMDVPKVDVVDTLGAGDFFHGALTYRIAKHGLDDALLVDDLGFASAVAAQSVTGFGTRTWLNSTGEQS
jgi:sugar/nucleoside kinase (ribokinase family)